MAGRLILCVVIAAAMLPARGQTIPKTWDEKALATGLLPPPVAGAKVTLVTADYYYRIPERVMYRQYPVYAARFEPPGYLAELARKAPEVVFDPAKLKTEDDWIAAGREVFRYPTRFAPVKAMQAWRGILERSGVRPARDGTYPQLSLVVVKKGVVMAGFLSCATCHTRIQPDGEVIEGGQGSVPDLLLGFPPGLEVMRSFERALFRVPWLKEDSEDRVDSMSIDQVHALKAAIPVGVVARHGTSLFSPVQIPDLIGVRDRRYLDHTGLMRHRGIGDMMRYAALNQGADMLTDYSGFRPTYFLTGEENKLPPPEKLERYSEAQLFALAKYVYSLKPPANPNPVNALSRRGEAVFAREGCARCHTPPLYTSNRITPALGYKVREEDRQVDDIEPTVVGTDPTLAMRTRRATGFYKVPSLRGVWYRGPLEHDGSVATLEDWFDPRRLRDDYVPTGYKGDGVTHRAVRGHPFGLGLSEEDKAALIAFLRTL
jgi:hypothetical protein